MTTSTQKSAYWAGVRDGAPFLFVAGPFAMLFGLLAAEAGLNAYEALAFSIVVIAGAAQFTALQLMQENVPTFIVLASALAVNLRLAMYSASITPYIGAAPVWQRALAAYFLVDQTYASAIGRYEAQPDMTVPERMAYFAGVSTSVCPGWYIFTVVGALVGAQIPEAWALDFALPLAFLAMISPLLRTPAHMVAALVAIVVSLMATNIPYSLGLLVAGICGMVAGAQAELWFERRKQRAI